MRRRWPWLCLWLGATGALAAALVLAALLEEPTGVLAGYLAHEAFYHGRPTRYWRRVLCMEGQQGTVSPEVEKEFRGSDDPGSVLLACAHDPDSHVRWPAVNLLGKYAVRTQRVLDGLAEALDDPETQVRLQALRALAGWGALAKPAFPAVAVRLQDPELQAAHYADLALWRIDPAEAVVACGWRPFTSAEFGVAAMLPEEPEREEVPVLGGLGVAHSFQAWHRAGSHPAPTRYVVLVTEYADGAVMGTEEERFRALKDSAPFLTGGKVVEDKEVSLGDLRGHEYLVEAKGLGFLRQRAFWRGQKLYAAIVAYQRRFVNEPAATYFLDSLRVDTAAHHD